MQASSSRHVIDYFDQHGLRYPGACAHALCTQHLRRSTHGRRIVSPVCKQFIQEVHIACVIVSCLRPSLPVDSSRRLAIEGGANERSL